MRVSTVDIQEPNPLAARSRVLTTFRTFVLPGSAGLVRLSIQQRVKRLLNSLVTYLTLPISMN